MEWSKLKNIILMILLTTNVFLLGLVGLRSWNTSSYQAEARQDALKVLEQNGIKMEMNTLPEDQVLQVATVERERAREAEVLAPLLGEVSETALGGGQYHYTGEKGEAFLRGRGEFELTLTPGTYPASGDMEAHAVETLSLMGIQGIVVYAEGGPQNGTVTLFQQWEEISVRNCQVTAAYEGGNLISLSGTRISGTPVSGGEVELSAVTGLLRFMEKFMDTGDICNEVLVMQAGYQLTTSLSEPSVLIPIWYFVTDTGAYTLDMTTNQLKRM